MKRLWQTFTVVFVLILLLCATGMAQAHPLLQQSAPTLLINDLSLTTDGRAQPATIEIYDGGHGTTTLDGLFLLFLTTEKSVIAAYDLSTYQTDNDGFLQLQAGSDFSLDTTAAEPSLIDSVVLATADASDLTPGAILDPGKVLDGISFGVNAGTVRSITDGDQVQANTLFPLAPLPAAAAALSDTIPAPSQPSGTIPAAANAECGTDATLIHEIQGQSDSSPLNNKVVTIEGIVVGDFQDVRTQLRGFFVQEEASAFDENPATSEGIYVFDSGFGIDVRAGDLVRVRGQVAEYNTMTELKRLESVLICSQGNAVEPVAVTFPLNTAAEMEQYEGMLIHLDGAMSVAQNYFLGRYGQITIVADGRAYQPTNLYPPGSADAIALAEANAARLLILDDGQDIRVLGDNPNPVPYLGTPETTIVRAGDTISNVVGVIDYGRIDSAPGSEVGLGYRLQPVVAPTFATANPRSATPPIVGGTLKVTSFNVLNYFNGNGSGGGFPTSRGAKSAAEFDRQRTKIIAALSAMNADVIGLMEIENDGYGPQSALQDLANGLNEAVAAAGSEATYAFIDPGLERLGADEITVGILYNSTTITPTGSAATLATGAFDQELADFGRGRQPLAQTFVDRQGERFTLIVNHFKSKRPSGTPDEANVDHGDGAGAWNGRRTEMAQDLSAWLATDPTGSGDPDFLVVGDLNAYAKESPITAFEDSGYVNLIAHYGGTEAYSYVYDGELGYLDHALASSTLLSQTTGAMDWHINADEAKVLDYDAQFNPPGYYSPDPFRASDHDPVLIGLTLTRDAGEEPGGEEPGGEEPGGEEPGGGDQLENQSLTVHLLPGDTLSRVARRYSVTIAALAEANGLSAWSYVYPNQELTVPPVADDLQCVRTIYSDAGETFTQLAERFGADPVRLAIANQLSTMPETVDGKPICLPRIY